MYLNALKVLILRMGMSSLGNEVFNENEVPADKLTMV